MKLFLLRLWAAIVLLVATAVPSERVSAQTYAAHERQHEECVQQHDLLGTSQAEERQRPYGEAIVKTLPLQRIGSSRPSRLFPTHGGKSGRSLGHGTPHHSFNHLILVYRHLGSRLSKSCGGAALPRYYYVIALRRILC